MTRQVNPDSFSDETTEITTLLCPRCGRRHEITQPAPDPEELAASENNLIWLSLVGIGALVLIWFWVFRWGVPLIKGLTQ